MDRLSEMDTESLILWLTENGIPSEVIDSFQENAMDGEALVTLVGFVPGPDCLKELITKVGLRIKVYKLIKSLYNGESSCSDNTIIIGGGNEPSCSSSEYPSSPMTSTSILDTPETSPIISSYKISSKDVSPVSSKRLQLRRPSNLSKSAKIIKGNVPDPFPIPTFRSNTEENLAKHLIPDEDRKYMVQTLSTILMTYKQKPALSDCLIVSKSLHAKFKFMGGEESQNSWRWFIYTRTHNVNKRPGQLKDDAPQQKKSKTTSEKHYYPSIPDSSEDEESSKRNLALLKAECLKPKPCHETIKTLLIRTHPVRRAELLSSPDISLSSLIQDYPFLKKCSYISLEFSLVMQRPDIRETFEADLIFWSKAIIMYCETTQMRSTAIKKLIDAYYAETDSDESTTNRAIRCLCLLLISTKTKKDEGDIPYVMKFVPNGTTPSEAPDKDNNQPHIVVITKDEYCQYFVAIEQTMMLECNNIMTALFLLLASHYVFNLSYHPKATDFFLFLQERVAGISSITSKQKRNPVANSHVIAVARMHDELKNGEDDEQYA